MVLNFLKKKKPHRKEDKINWISIFMEILVKFFISIEFLKIAACRFWAADLGFTFDYE